MSKEEKRREWNNEKAFSKSKEKVKNNIKDKQIEKPAEDRVQYNKKGSKLSKKTKIK